MEQTICRQIQELVCEILNNDPELKGMGIEFYPEDNLDIDFLIKNAMNKQGIACVVMTPTMEYQGHDALTQAFTLEDLTIQVVENTNINRPRLKKLGLEHGTALDVVSRASEVLGGPQSGHYGEFTTRRIEQGEDSNLVVAKVVMATTIRREVTGIIEYDEEGKRVEIPFVTKDEIKNLENEVEHLQELVIGFDTEGIKEELHQVEGSIEGIQTTLAGLSEIYQPIGNYATIDDLAEFALKSEIPTKVSQLENDSGYLTDVEWNSINHKPDVALRSEIPTKTSDLENDSITTSSINAVNKAGDIIQWLQIGRDESNIKLNPGDYEDGASIIVSGGWNSGGKILVNGENASIKINDKNVLTEDNIPEIPTKTSQLENDSDFTTNATLNNAVGELNSRIDLESTTRTEVTEDIYGKLTLKANKDEVPTKVSELDNDSGYLTTVSWNEITDKPEIPTNIPTKVSELENDVGYALISDVEAVYDELPTKLSQLENDSGYLTKEIADNTYLTEHQSLADYITRTYFNYEISRIDGEIETLSTNLTNGLEQKADKNDIPVNVSQLVNDSGYLTTHQYLGDYLKKSDAQTLYQPKGEYLTEHQSLYNYYTKGECDQLFGNSGNTYRLYSIADAQYIDGYGVIWIKQNGEYVQRGQLAMVENIPTRTSDLLNDSGYLTTVSWNTIVDKPEIPTMEYVDQKIGQIETELDGKMDKDGIDQSAIFNSTRKIDAYGDVYQEEYTPAHWTNWMYSDGIDHGEPEIVEFNSRWRIVVDDVYQTDDFITLEMAQEALNGNLLTFNYATEQITATREWIEEESGWNKIDELAYRSEIQDTGVTEEFVEEYVTESLSPINNQISSINSSISEQGDAISDNTGRIDTIETSVQELSDDVDGVQTSVNSIQTTLNGGSWTTLIGETESGQTITFQIFTKGI